MEKILEHFKKISSIPHCSFEADLLKEEIISFSKRNDFEVFEDKEKNILCKKGTPKIALQAHYDMVCIGEAPCIKLVQEKNILKAKNSSLGADNGMGMAIMFSMMEKYSDIECLFTSNEEVGLLGASNLELQLSSNKLLNLDGEQEDEVYVGCAGGVDIVCTCKVQTAEVSADLSVYKVSISGLKGGHSGVDIDKGIPSAIKVLAQELYAKEVKIIDIYGGEMRNSIPKNAYAIIASYEPFESQSNFVNVEKIEFANQKYFLNSDKIIKVIHAFAQGVREFDKKYNIPKTSISMGKIRYEDGILQVDCAARSLADEDLDILALETCSLFELAGFETQMKNPHPAWSPNIGDFTLLVREEMSKIYSNVELKAIHAGLECGVLMQTQKHPVEAVSMGPTIRFPHSASEECDLNSVFRIAQAVENIIQKIQKV